MFITLKIRENILAGLNYFKCSYLLKIYSLDKKSSKEGFFQNVFFLLKIYSLDKKCSKEGFSQNVVFYGKDPI